MLFCAPDAPFLSAILAIFPIAFTAENPPVDSLVRGVNRGTFLACFTRKRAKYYIVYQAL